MVPVWAEILGYLGAFLAIASKCTQAKDLSYWVLSLLSCAAFLLYSAAAPSQLIPIILVNLAMLTVCTPRFLQEYRKRKQAMKPGPGGKPTRCQ